MKPNRSKETEMNPTPMSEVESNPADVDVQERIARRAYELYEQRGGAGGNEQDDWFLAEAEIRAALGSPTQDQAESESALHVTRPNS